VPVLTDPLMGWLGARLSCFRAMVRHSFMSKQKPSEASEPANPWFTGFPVFTSETSEPGNLANAIFTRFARFTSE
jgi:hypothetical protein